MHSRRTYVRYMLMLVAGLCFLASLPLSTGHVFAQSSQPAIQVDVLQDEALQADSLAVTVRQPPASILSAYRDNPAYQYRQPADQVLTFWDKLKRLFFDWLNRLMDENSQRGIWEYVIYAIAIGLVLFAILRAFKMDLRALFSPKKRPVLQAVGLVDELSQSTDFIALAETARKDGDFRLSARMYYMHVLKVLDAGEVIRWSPRKTNQDYVYECRQSDIQQPFRRLTYLFDYAWYGDFPVDQAVVAEMQTLAQDVSRRVK